MSKILNNLTVLIVENEGDGKKIVQEVMRDKFETDVFMPIMNGLDMAKSIKEISKDTPIIVFSTNSEKETLLKAIDVGIDKYVLKPIDLNDFLVTLENVAKNKIETANIIQVTNGYSFNKIKRVLIRDGVEISLTKKELAFISLLIKRLGTLVLHDEIKNVVWVGESVTEAAIRTFVKRVRDKVGSNFIKNVPGLGYKIDRRLS